MDQRGAAPPGAPPPESECDELACQCSVTGCQPADPLYEETVQGSTIVNVLKSSTYTT